LFEKIPMNQLFTKNRLEAETAKSEKLYENQEVLF